MTAFVAVLTVILAIVINSESKLLKLETHMAKGGHTVHVRTGATSGKAVFLQGKKASVSMSFCLKVESTSFKVSGITFSNDGRSEMCSVSVDGDKLGRFSSVGGGDHGRLWNIFRNSGPIGRSTVLGKGIHYLRIHCDTRDGIEIDTVSVDVGDDSLTSDTFRCQLHCQALSPLKKPPRPNLFSTNATVTQRSYKTRCAEEDNVHVPIYMPGVANYTIAATRPTYSAFINRRNPDETNCNFLPPVHWRFEDFRLTRGSESMGSNEAKLTVLRPKGVMRHSVKVKVSFRLDGRSKGHLDSEIGSFLVLKLRPVRFSLLVSVTYVGRHGYRTNIAKKYILPGQRELVWNFPDFTWGEFIENSVTVALAAVRDVDLHVQELRMERRYMKPERMFDIYRSDEIIIEGIDADFWWTEPDKMTARRIDNGQKWPDVDYFRILRPVPWGEGYAQVFVLYQDGNARLLQLPPSGLDWIPFGSSVIIGQSDPRAFRPSSLIAHVDFNPEEMDVKLYFRDGGTAKLHLDSQPDKTTLTVSDIQFTDTLKFPFATLRSMYIEDGNSDCDRVMVDDSEVYNIMDQWRAKFGHSFLFFRQCESKHLTFGPDIRLDITGVHEE